MEFESGNLVKVVVGAVLIIVGLALAGVLLGFGQTAYTSLNGYSWGSAYSPLVQIVILMFIVAIIVVGIYSMVSAFL